ncbi:MAG TPA: tetratricopeptide repeat protein [Polyangia bacterium]|nr:tetratricopeptide repeat protein [Polyangia bacterium]
MRVTRTLDLIVLVLLATVLLMPRPDATVKAALAVDPELRDRVAELQSILAGKPDSVDAAIELANVYLDGHRPDWALATVSPLVAAHPDDYRLQHLRAIAYADRFEGAPAFAAATQALALCERQPAPTGAPACGDAAHARLVLLRSALESVAAVDMKNQPYLAKDRIFRELHPVFVPRPKSKTAKLPKPPLAAPAAPAPKP